MDHLLVPTPQPADALFANARHLRKRNIQLARRLRAETTVPERRMWKLLHSLDGYRFRRQVPIGRFVVDFACHRHRLVVELDGETHFTADAIEKDQQRTNWLNALGYRVLRFTNSDLITNPDGVWISIAAALTDPPPSPLRGGVGGGGGEVTTDGPPPSFPPLKGEGGKGTALSSLKQES